MTFSCNVIDLGLIPYEAAYASQKAAVQEVINGAAPCLLLCEHPAVLTLGRLADESYILTPRLELQQQGIVVKSIDRGGEVTLHAPGQLVAYPIMDLTQHGKDLHVYIRRLEQTAIVLLQSYGIPAQRNPGKTGVWVGHKKIVSIGLGVKKWISYHGLAINVNTDLKLFSIIKPCGLDVEMTSIKEVLGSMLDIQDVKQKYQKVFCKEFNLESARKNLGANRIPGIMDKI